MKKRVWLIISCLITFTLLGIPQVLALTEIDEIEPNNTVEQANQTIIFDEIVHGTISDIYNDKDYYKLTITNYGTLNIMGSFHGYEEYLAITLKDNNDNFIAQTALKGYPDETNEAQFLKIEIKPGTYYLNVYQTSSYEALLIYNSYFITTWMSNIIHNPPEDIDDNGFVNSKDLNIVSNNYNYNIEPESFYNSEQDLNNDRIIDLFDMVKVSREID